MDPRLQERLNQWHAHLEFLQGAEQEAMTLDASEKTLFAEMLLRQDGKTVSERESAVYASSEWKDFTEGMIAAKSRFNHAKRLLELKIKAYEAEYLALKTEAEAIRRMP